MNIYATNRSLRAWTHLPGRERSRSLAATYFAPAKQAPAGDAPDNEYKKKGIQAIISAAELQEFGSHWQQFVAALPADKSRSIRATLQSRLLVNLSGSVLENAGISLEHVCGVPIIPGSAVKGAARHYAIALMQECDEAQKEELLATFIDIFGCVQADFEPESDLALAVDSTLLHELGELYGKRKGQVCFLQAVPQQSIPLCADVLTPHHKKYMSGNNPDPTDDEDPEPGFFPAVECSKESVYSFALYTPTKPELLDTAEKWLTQALSLFGIGAKGAAGYGYFSVEDKSLQNFTPEQQEAILFIAKKEKLHDMFSKFHKEKDKKPMIFWALLRAISLPEEDPTCRLKDFREFLDKNVTDKKEDKARKKALEAMLQMAQEHHINLPYIP